jgi:hypothetical protein
MTRRYQMEPLRQRLFLLAGAVLAGFGVLWPVISLIMLGQLGLDLLDVVLVGIPTATFLGVGFYVANAGRTIILELSEAGVVLRLPGGSAEAAWQDVQAVGPAAWGPLSGQSLILRGPAGGRRPWWLGLLGSEGMERAIPLSPFALPLTGSRLEADLRGYLPDLFD